MLPPGHRDRDSGVLVSGPGLFFGRIERGNANAVLFEKTKAYDREGGLGINWFVCMKVCVLNKRKKLYFYGRDNYPAFFRIEEQEAHSAPGGKFSVCNKGVELKAAFSVFA